jgi:CspA family cold shock protein
MVIWFNQQKGYGFIRRDDGQDVFVHTKVMPAERDIRLGDRVRFKTSTAYKGQLAVGVKKI